MLLLWSAVTPQNIARISRGQEQYVGFLVSCWCLAAVIRPVSEAAAPAPVPGPVVAEGAAVGAVAVAVGVAAAVVTHLRSVCEDEIIWNFGFHFKFLLKIDNNFPENKTGGQYLASSILNYPT